jgi:hypothetical protein
LTGRIRSSDSIRRMPQSEVFSSRLDDAEQILVAPAAAASTVSATRLEAAHSKSSVALSRSGGNTARRSPAPRTAERGVAAAGAERDRSFAFGGKCEVNKGPHPSFSRQAEGPRCCCPRRVGLPRTARDVRQASGVNSSPTCLAGRMVLFQANDVPRSGPDGLNPQFSRPNSCLQ